VPFAQEYSYSDPDLFPAKTPRREVFAVNKKLTRLPNFITLRLCTFAGDNSYPNSIPLRENIFI